MAFIVDAYSQMILGWVVTTVMDTHMVLMALEHALFFRRPTKTDFTSTGIVHHSDAGAQYTSLVFTDVLVEAGLQGSIGSVGDALDNAMMESLIGLYTTELIDFELQRTWRDVQEVENFKRPRGSIGTIISLSHSSTGDVPPIEYEQDYEEFNTTRKAQ